MDEVSVKAPNLAGRIGIPVPARKIVRARNVVLLFVVAFVIWDAEFAYRKNSICSLEDHPIQSEADAIAVVKKKIVKDRSFSFQLFGSAPEFVDTLHETENCCSAVRTRNIFGVILWSVYLDAKASAKYNRRTVYVSSFGRGFAKPADGNTILKIMVVGMRFNIVVAGVSMSRLLIVE
jgi:hypothetical protein